MSFRAIERVLQNSSATGANRVVLFVLAHLANERGQSWHGMASLMRKTRLSERQIRISTRELQQAGDINVYLGQGPSGTNVYQVLCFGGPTNTEFAQSFTPPADCAPQSAGGHIVPPAQEVSPSAPKLKGTDNEELTVGAGGASEIPSEADVLAEGKAYPGNTGIGANAQIPEAWCLAWYAAKLGYRNFAWVRWKVVLKLDFERDFRNRLPQALGQSGKNNHGQVEKPSNGDLLEALRVARHLNDAAEVERLTRALNE